MTRARFAALATALVLGACASSSSCTGAAAACQSDNDCPSDTTCASDGFCVARSGEGESSEGEGSASEGEGSASEGEGAVGEGEGEGVAGEGEGEGEGEGVAGEGEGEGEGGLGTVVLPFSASSTSYEVALAHNSGVQASSSICSCAEHTPGASVALSCTGGLMGTSSIVVSVDGHDEVLTLEFVPDDWQDLSRTERALVAVNYLVQNIDMSSVSGTTPLWIPARVLPAGALADSPAFFAKGSADAAPLDVELDASGAWTEVPAGTSSLWLYFHDAQPSNPSTPPTPAFGDVAEAFHFGSSVVPNGDESVERNVSLQPATLTNGGGVEGKGLALSGTQAEVAQNVTAVSEATGTLSCFEQTTDTSQDAVLVYATSSVAVSGTQNASGGPDEYYLFLDHNSRLACAFLGTATLCDTPLSSATNMFDGAFHQIAATWSATSTTLVVDGRVKTSFRGSPVNVVIDTLAVGGALAAGGTPNFHGVIDEVRASTQALPANVLKLDFASTSNDAVVSNGHRFLESQHLAHVQTATLQPNGALTTSVPVDDFPERAAMTGEPATILALFAVGGATYADTGHGAGLAFTNVAPLDQLSAHDGAHIVAVIGTGTFDPTTKIDVFHALASDTNTAATTPVNVALLYFTGSPAPALVAHGALVVGGNQLTLENSADDTSFVSVASTNGAPTVRTGDDAIVSLPAGANVPALTIFEVASDPALTTTTLDVPSNSDAAFGTFGVSP